MPLGRGERNLAVLAERALEQHGDYDAVFFEGRWHGSGELHERARCAAGGLAALGVRRGDRVVCLMGNSPDVGVVYQAIWRAGAAATPASFLLSEEELARVVAASEARLVVASSQLAESARETGAEVTTPDELAAGEPAPIAPRADSDLAALLYTGGTTGRAKGVMLSHAGLWHAGEAGYRAGHVPGVRRGLASLPLSHSYGILMTAVSLHAQEPPETVLLRWFEPDAWLEHAQAQRVEMAALVPSMLQLLLARPLEDYDLSALRYVVCGAAPLPSEAAAALARRLPHVELREGYGLTETSALVASNPPGRVRAGSVGLPVPGTEVEILDEADSELQVGEVGEICVRSPSLMLGYWRDEALTAEALRGGRLHTGDMGRLDGDGYLYVVDRKKDLIIRGGFNVFPRDVEEALLAHEAVAAAAVVGRPDSTRGEEVVAFVTLAEGLAASEEELVAFGRQRLGSLKYAREVHVVDSLPLTPVGKVDRRALRAELGARVEEATRPPSRGGHSDVASDARGAGVAELTLAELEAGGERDLGASSWVELDQRAIDLFAEATGDHQWIHVDPERASRGPFGQTIAHGYLTLSLLPALLGEVLSVPDRRMGVNYGIERVRFTAPVPSGSRVRLRARLLGGERRGEGVLFRIGAEVEIEGAAKPALVGEVLYLAY